MIIFSLVCLLVSVLCAIVDTKLVYCRRLGTIYNIFWGNLTYRILGQLAVWSTVSLFLLQLYFRSTFVNYLEIGGLISANSDVFLQGLVDTSNVHSSVENSINLFDSSDSSELLESENVRQTPDYVRALWAEKHALPRRTTVVRTQVIDLKL